MSVNVRSVFTVIIVLSFCTGAYCLQLAPEELSADLAKPDPAWGAVDEIWKHSDSVLVGETNDKATWDRFYGAGYYAGGEYKISVEIRHDKVGEWGGGGLMFNSEDSRDRNPAMMTRIVADRLVIAGYFTSGGAYKQHKSLEVDGGISEGWHTLRAHVKGNDGVFDVYLDDEKMLGDIPLTFDRGHFGFTICDGTVSYRNFKFTQIEPAQPRKTFKSGNWFGFSMGNELISSDPLTSSLLFYDRKGALQRTFKTAHGVDAFDINKGTIAAVSPFRPLAQFYKEDGTHLGDLPLKTHDDAPITDITALHLDKNGFLYILSNASKTLYRLKGKSRPMELSIEIADPDANLVDFDVCGKSIYVIDDKAFVYTYKISNLLETPKLLDTFRTSGGGDIHAIAANDRNLYTIERDKVVRYSLSGKKRSVFRGYKLAGFSPSGLRAAPKRTLRALDRANNSVITLNEILTEDFPTVRFPSKSSAEITWTTAHPARGTVTVLKDDRIINTIVERKISRKHTALVENLVPNTRYEFSIDPEESAFPETLSERRHPFVTPAGKGLIQYVDYPVAVFLFTNVVDDGLQKPEWPDTMKPISDKEIERFKDEIRHTSKFYFLNSHLKYNVKPDFFVVDKKMKRSDVFGEGSSYPPKKELIYQIIGERKADASKYNAALYVSATQAYSDKTGKYYIRGYGGGFTRGTDGKDPGICWWEMTMRDHGAGNDWLMLHEFNHQTDAMMAASGHPEYWFNHYAMLDDNVGKFYWWYDADGYLIRETTPVDWWIHCRFGELKYTEDKDQDGIPDNDPNLWVDEARLGTDPKKKDTDGDGMNDLDELLAWNNSERGWGEDYGGRRIKPDPTKPDSDGDGLKDGEDPHPMFTNSFEIRKGSHDIDKPFNRNEWSLLYTLSDPRIAYSVFANWDEDNLYIAIEAPQNAMRSIALDATTDGWFTGSDNYRFQWGYRGREFRYELYNCSDPTKFGFNDKALIEGDYVYRVEKKRDLSVLLFSLAKNDKTGLMMKLGDTLALQVIAGPAPNAYGWSRYISYFEPNKLMDFKLVEE